MKIIIADYIYTPQGYISGNAIAFDTSIRGIDEAVKLTERFPDATIIRTEPHTILYPGLINTHVHLEFSANSTTLKYGEFMPWLDSVIEHRTELIEDCDSEMMSKACDEMLHSGITSFGAISSFGLELEACKSSAQKVTFFNELIGSDPATADVMYGDFLERLSISEAAKAEEQITPAIAIHSPYSVHPVVIKKAMTLAIDKSLPVSTHLLESPAEREWLESNQGGFLTFFQKFFKKNHAITTIDEFIQQFDNHPTHFVHCTQATADELSYLSSKGHSVAHCPRSNRVLGCGRLEIENLLDTPMSISTDGLSSNWTLNIWDELRAAIMLHHKGTLNLMADRFIRSVTSDAAIALRSNVGRLEVDAPADLITVTLPSRCEDESALSLHAILHTNKATSVYINGEEIV